MLSTICLPWIQSCAWFALFAVAVLTPGLLTCGRRSCTRTRVALMQGLGEMHGHGSTVHNQRQAKTHASTSPHLCHLCHPTHLLTAMGCSTRDTQQHLSRSHSPTVMRRHTHLTSTIRHSSRHRRQQVKDVLLCLIVLVHEMVNIAAWHRCASHFVYADVAVPIGWHEWHGWQLYAAFSQHTVPLVPPYCSQHTVPLVPPYCSQHTSTLCQAHSSLCSRCVVYFAAYSLCCLFCRILVLCAVNM